jgi:hypothetical protein
MNDDVKKYIYIPLVLLAVGLVAWIGYLFVVSCGFSFACAQGAMVIERTPVPTLIPAKMPAAEMNVKAADTSDKCRIAAADLIGAWVDSGASDTDAFQFADADGKNCEAAFAEVQPLFTQMNFWYGGSLSCVACHGADVKNSAAQLDLSSYAGIKAGSRRADETASGTDILGSGKWEGSLLKQFLSAANANVKGHTASLSTGYFVFAGKPLPPTATPTP